MFCSKCGKENDDDAKFCSSCGNSFKSSVEKTAEEKAQEIKQKSKESASTLKPLLKLKIVAPTLVIVFTVIFWGDIASFYWEYKHEKAREERLAKEKKEKEEGLVWLNKYQKTGVFADNEQRLIWQDDYAAATVKKPWVTQANYDAKNYMDTSGDTATTYCSNLSLAGYSDWRLPIKTEITGLYVNRKYLKHVIPSFYWSSSTHVFYNERASVAGFGNGNDGYSDKYSNFYVRCVRSVQ